MNKKDKAKSILILSVIWIVWVGFMYYLFLPAANIHATGFWSFVIFVCLFPAGLLMLGYDAMNSAMKNDKNLLGVEEKKKRKKKEKHTESEVSRTTIILLLTPAALGILMVLLLLFGSPMFHASSYSALMIPQEADFQEDINSQTALSKIALMDTDSAILFGNREIGSLSNVVSQYEVSEAYTQIDYEGSPMKVSALRYAGFFKYMGNKENGVPGYVTVDPVGQNAEYVALEEGMTYVPSAYFQRDLKRHLRLEYPAEIFGNIHFEVNEEGRPYYVASVYDYTIGVFGGKTVKGAIVCDPVTGGCEYYAVGEIPQWIDVVFDGDLLVQQYDWHGKLSNGFVNSLFGKKGCKKCTETVERNMSEDDETEDKSVMADYGYVAKDGDIWIYTGITSVNDDASNIGLLMVNERTAEARYYTIAGADESSAMAAAEGEVQEKGYQASFPSVINVEGQPTYVMVLKDANGIVKLYAMVNMESYNVVTTAGTIENCFNQYRTLLGIESEEGSREDSSDTDNDSNDGTEADVDSKEDDNAVTVPVEFVIASIQYVDIDGNTYVYLIGEDGNVYKQKFYENEELIFLNPGNSVSADCIQETEKVYRIKTIKQ